MRFICLIGLIIGIVGLLPVSQVEACSGPGVLTLEQRLEISDLIVRGTIIEVDDMAQNGILRVESYLEGEPGAEYLLISQTTPGFMQALEEHLIGGGDCLSFGNWLHPGDEIIVTLVRSPNGSYQIVRDLAVERPWNFPTPDSTVTVYRDDDPNFEGTELTETELTVMISDMSGQTPAPPLDNQPYPFTSPLLISTSSGSLYTLPLDHAAPVLLDENVVQYAVGDRAIVRFRETDVADGLGELPTPHQLDIAECAKSTCVDVTSDGNYAAFRSDADTIRVCAIARSLADCGGLDGQAFLFIEASQTLLIWDDQTLKVYQLLTSFRNRTSLMFSHELNYAADQTPGLLAKHTIPSPDGRQIVFSDAAGLWLWDLFTGQPELVIPASESIPYARYFSPNGRFIAIEEGDVRSNFDLVSRTHLPDGVFSPEDQFLVAIDTLTQPSEATFCPLTPYQCDQFTNSLNAQFTWITPYQYLMFECDDDLACVLNITFGDDHRVLTPQIQWSEQLRYDFDPAGYNVAVQDSPTTLLLLQNVHPSYAEGLDYQTLDLSDVIEGEITAIQWMPPLFYDE